MNINGIQLGSLTKTDFVTQPAEVSNYVNDNVVGMQSYLVNYISMRFGQPQVDYQYTAAVAIGNNALALNNSAIAIGINSKTTNIGAISLGSYAQANGQFSNALGNQTSANADYSIALGYKATTKDKFSVAIGNKNTIYGAMSNGEDSVSFGPGPDKIFVNSYQYSNNLSSLQQIFDTKADLSNVTNDSIINIIKNDLTSENSQLKDVILNLLTNNN